MNGYVLPRSDEEQQIIRALSADEQSGFEALYEKYAPPLRAFCTLRLSDPHEAEDACHETLLRACGAIHRFQTGKRLWPWLSTIAANVCRDITDSKRRLCGPAAESDWIGDAESEAFSSIRVQISRRALDRLAPDYRAILLLSQFDGLSNKQIATNFGLSISAVKNRLLRARRSLQQQVRIVAKKWGQWPLPVLAPSLKGRRERELEPRSFLRRQLDRLWPQNAAGIRVVGCGIGADSIGNFLVATSAVGLLAISLMFSAPPSQSPAAINVPNATPGELPQQLPRDDGVMLSDGARRVRADFFSEDLPSHAPPSSASMDVGWKRDKDERASVNAKIVARLEGTPGADLGGNQLVWFYCDSDRINAATCDAVDSLP